MDDYRSFSDSMTDWEFPDNDEPCMDPPPSIGTDERRMHVRAYEHWVSLLDGRSYPAIADLDADDVGDFRPHSVLIDFSEDPVNPRIAFVGRALRDEGRLDGDIETVADVPDRSLISRLTDHYDEILANRAPVGFEAEFVNQRGQLTLYRGILMPYSSDGEAIDFIYGVINWKLSAEEALPQDIVAALTTAFAGPAQPVPDAPVDEAPYLSFDDIAAPDLEELIDDARDLAIEARDSEHRSHVALYRTISLVYDLALAGANEPERFAALIEAANIPQQARAPMTPVLKLVFGIDHDRKRISEYAAVLTHAQRLCLAPGMVESWLGSVEGGIKGVVAAERRDRRPALKIDRAKSARMKLRGAAALAIVDIGQAMEDEFVLLVARRNPDGGLHIISPVSGDKAMVDRALRHVAG